MARIKWLAQEAEAGGDLATLAPFVRRLCAKYQLPVPRSCWPVDADWQPSEPRRYVLHAEPGRYDGALGSGIRVR